MRQHNWIVTTGLGAAMLAMGCQDRTPPVPRVPSSSLEQPAAFHQHDPPRPLVPPVDPNEGRLYDDQPLVTERPPEQSAFIDAYNKIGRPRMVLFVNRALDGQPIAPTLGDPPVGHEVAPPPGTYEPYLRPGQYDETFARAIDFQAIETILTDWLAANGQTTLVSPTMVRQQLTDTQVRDLQAGDARPMSDLMKKLDADVLIQAQIRVTAQSSQGLKLRAVVEAINVRDGQSVARAMVDIPPPLEKTTMNKYTRYLARKLMDDMTGTWTAFLANQPPTDNRPAPQPAPPAPQAAPQSGSEPPAFPQPAPPATFGPPTRQNGPAPTNPPWPSSLPGR